MLSQSIGEGLDDGIAAFGGEGSHVEDGADGFTAAADRAFALVLAAVTIEGGQTDEGGDLLAVEFSQFGHVRDEGGGGDAAQPWDGLNELSLLAPLLVGLDEGLDRRFDAVDLPLQDLEHGLDAFLGGFGGCDFQSIGLHRSEVDELPSAADELLDFGLFFRSFLAGGGLHLLGEQSQHAGVDAVGFRAAARSRLWLRGR